MSEPKPRRSDWPIWLVIVIGLPTLYVLSVGPMAALWEQGNFSEPAKSLVQAFYYPLRPIFGRGGPFKDVGRRYIDLFRK